mmetsp:Transcript_10418/g.40526  ORF Transcript_10418/g.40526 Transcript_10418/m.40526 type:complete len:219 (+) Transcript_10418:6256-6912(+)
MAVAARATAATAASRPSAPTMSSTMASLLATMASTRRPLSCTERSSGWAAMQRAAVSPTSVRPATSKSIMPRFSMNSSPEDAVSADSVWEARLARTTSTPPALDTARAFSGEEASLMRVGVTEPARDGSSLWDFMASTMALTAPPSTSSAMCAGSEAMRPMARADDAMTPAEEAPRVPRSTDTPPDSTMRSAVSSSRARLARRAESDARCLGSSQVFI